MGFPSYWAFPSYWIFRCPVPICGLLYYKKDPGQDYHCVIHKGQLLEFVEHIEI